MICPRCGCYNLKSYEVCLICAYPLPIDDDIYELKIKVLDKQTHRYLLEHDCDTTVTDEDMLRLHINIALDDGDRLLFEFLSRQLKGMVE